MIKCVVISQMIAPEKGKKTQKKVERKKYSNLTGHKKQKKEKKVLHIYTDFISLYIIVKVCKEKKQP